MRAKQAIRERWPKQAPRLFAALLVFSVLLPASSLSQAVISTTPLTYQCQHVSTPITVDGKLNDLGWSTAAWTSDFVDIQGTGYPAPKYRTRAKLLWDDEFLYIAAEIQEPNVHGSKTKHDSVIFRDNDFEVFLMPLPQTPSYYELELNALNTTWDLFLPEPYKLGGKPDNSWEAVGLKTAVAVEGTLNLPTDVDRGWTVEIAYPFSAFNSRQSVLAPHNDTIWRMNLSRVEWLSDHSREENWVWTPQGIVDMHIPERWGYLRFLKPQVAEKTGLSGSKF